MTTQPIPQGMTPNALFDLHKQAADWFIRRQQPDWTAADERAMAAWLATDPLRQTIMDGLDRTWHQAESLKVAHPQVYGPPADAPALAHSSVRPQRAWSPSAAQAAWPLVSRRGFLVPALAAAGVALVVGGWQRWDTAARYSLDIATRPGETRAVDLPDGSRIDLNVASALRVRYYPRRREVALVQGEAFFQVAADVSRPFTVNSGASRVRVVGTAFNMRAASAELVVKVHEGRVEVRPGRDETGRVLLLREGTGVGIDTVTGRYRNLHIPAQEVGGWRTGQIHFSRTPLAEVARELAQYLGHSVTVEGEDLQALSISGFLATREPEGFIRALPDVVPVRVERMADGAWRITRR